MRGAITVCVIAASEPTCTELCESCEQKGATLLVLSRSDLAQELPAASVRGAVVVVVRDTAEASLALSLGADEVLRAGEFDRAEFDQTLEHAQLRALARARRDRRALGTHPEEEGPSLLSSALGDQLVEPIFAASTECQHLTEAIRVLLDIGDDLVGWAALSAPTEELRRLAARRLAAPSASEVSRTLARMQAALGNAQLMAARLCELLAEAAGDNYMRADRLASEFTDLISPCLSSVAALRVAENSECSLLVPTGLFLSVAAVLVSNALGAIHDSGKPSGSIWLRTTEAEGVAVLTVEDDAPEMSPDLSGTLGPTAQSSSSRSVSGLASLRERLHARGGDLLLQSDETGTQVTVIFPPSETDLPVTTGMLDSAEPRLGHRSSGMN